MMHKRILIVDDEEAVLFTLERSLRKLGSDYEIVTARSGQDALERVKQGEYHLVITDLKMPGMDGVELTRAIQALSPTTAVIWITAYGSPGSEAEARRLNVHSYLRKPLDIVEIRRIAREAVDKVLSRTSKVEHLPSHPEDALRQCLSRLQGETAAHCVLLITTGGHIVDKAGTTAGLEVDTLAALVAGNFLAANEVARLLGRSSTFKLSYYESDSHNVYSYGVASHYLLVIVFGYETRPGVVWFYARRAVEELERVLATIAPIQPVAELMDSGFVADMQQELELALVKCEDGLSVAPSDASGDAAGACVTFSLAEALERGLIDRELGMYLSEQVGLG
ncbi:MAG: response regulator [Anaerolineae bacterium]|nr:response regulator [Anaerolineae bacterium]